MFERVTLRVRPFLTGFYFRGILPSSCPDHRAKWAPVCLPPPTCCIALKRIVISSQWNSSVSPKANKTKKLLQVPAKVKSCWLLFSNTPGYSLRIISPRSNNESSPFCRVYDATETRRFVRKRPKKKWTTVRRRRRLTRFGIFLKQTMEFPWFSNHDTHPDIVPLLLLVVRPN